MLVRGRTGGIFNDVTIHGIYVSTIKQCVA